MNREQAKQLLPIIQAFASGADVQNRHVDGSWHDVRSPLFVSASVDYRIKPKPLNVWLVLNRDDVIRNQCDSQAAAKSRLKNAEEDGEDGPYRIVHVREVIE